MHKIAVMFLFLCVQLLQGCAYGIYEDKRLIDTMTYDKALAAKIKTALMQEHFGSAFSVSVYCFYDNVFLVGEAPRDLQAKAIKIARSFHPRSVTPHWFAPDKSDRTDMGLATELRAALIATRGLSSTRIDTEVNAGKIVLLGVVHNDEEKQLAIRTARSLKGVVSVTSYLMLPQTG